MLLSSPVSLNLMGIEAVYLSAPKHTEHAHYRNMRVICKREGGFLVETEIALFFTSPEACNAIAIEDLVSTPEPAPSPSDPWLSDVDPACELSGDGLPF